MRITSPKLDANINLAQNLSNYGAIGVDQLRTCGGCNGDATVLINGYWPRCQPCANVVVAVWSQMRANKKGDDI